MLAENLDLYIIAAEIDRELGPLRDDYPLRIPALSELKRLEFDSPVTFFIGENGCGKSTLLESIAIAEGFNPEGGTRNFQFATQNSHSDFSSLIRLSRNPRRMGKLDGFFFRAESFYNVASELDNNLACYLGAYGGTSLHRQSHGESFLALITNRFWGNGLYLLDEPASALSPSRQLALLVAMHDLVETKSQFIIATHLPILMAYPGATILRFSDDGLKKVNYEETEHYRVTKAFLNRTPQYLAELFRHD